MLAPIVVFAYNRPTHIQRLLDSLAINPQANQSHLIVYVDGLKLDNTPETQLKRNEVIAILHGEKRFYKVDIIIHQHNKGLAKSIIEGVSDVLYQYNKAIVLEDDLIVAPSFLAYMNYALNIYENDLEVGQIGACNFFANGDQFPSSFFTVVPDCLGWATWKNRWQHFQIDGKKLRDMLLRYPAALDRFTVHGSMDAVGMLNDQITGRVSSWAIRWQAVCALKNWKTLYPNSSMTQHWASIEATHAQINILPPLADANHSIEKIEVSELPPIREALIKGYKRQTDFYGNPIPQSVTAKAAHYFRLFKAKLKNRLKILKNGYSFEGWIGNYESWQQAKLDCMGYDDQAIIQACITAANAIKNEWAACERDSILLDQLEYSEDLENAFLEIHSKQTALSVMDFGGSLGSTYSIYQQLLGDKIQHWGIVEQPHFVEVGKQQFSINKLNFYFNIHECHKALNPNVILLSSVLQYLENPYQLLEEIQQLNKPYIILDRTTVNFESQDIITKQHVPNYIYEGNYPCWFLSEQKLLQSFAPHYKLIHSFQSYCEKPSKINGKTDVNWKGYVFERVSP